MRRGGSPPQEHRSGEGRVSGLYPWIAHEGVQVSTLGVRGVGRSLSLECGWGGEGVQVSTPGVGGYAGRVDGGGVEVSYPGSPDGDTGVGSPGLSRPPRGPCPHPHPHRLPGYSAELGTPSVTVESRVHDRSLPRVFRGSGSLNAAAPDAVCSTGGLGGLPSPPARVAPGSPAARPGRRGWTLELDGQRL